MAQVKVFYDHEGGTLSVWWANPQDEEVCEEAGHGVILIKDKNDRVIGLEKLYLSLGSPKDFQVEVKTDADPLPTNAANSAAAPAR